MSIEWPARNYDEDIAHVVHELLATEGVRALTFRGIARAAQLSPGTLAYQFGSNELLLGRCTRVIGQLLVDDLIGRTYSRHVEEQLMAMVARDEYELADLKVWFDLVALGRTSPSVGHHVLDMGIRLRSTLTRRLCDLDLADPHLEGAQMAELVLQAVWSHQVTPGKDLDVEEAQELMRRLLPAWIRS